MSPFQGFDCISTLSHRLRGGLNNFALRASGAMAEISRCCSIARNLRRMEEKVAKTNGAIGNSSMSLFALSFLQEVR
jgi:hypothetical protein